MQTLILYFRQFRNVALFAFLAACGLPAQDTMRAYFLPVGQAHSTLLEFPCGAALIDAGAQDKESADRLAGYLDDFFESRPDLNRTLDLVLITHNHVDHNFALKTIAAKGFKIRNYVDDGILTGKGKPAADWIRKNAHTEGRNITVREVKITEIETSGFRKGVTDNVIDPLACPGTNPEVHVLFGHVTTRPANWTKQAFTNVNNHSLVTRVDFGQASFLFMGDLEEEGIERLIHDYSGGSAGTLDADVLQVGHHGSHNATTKELLAAVTPTIAVLPVGTWDFGKGSANKFTTNAYGHPRKATLDLLTEAIAGQRSEPIRVMAGTASRQFETYRVRKRIYATAWDGMVKIRATSDGKYVVTRE